ncbi:tannase/feruloyl esterase family alpha/beta hydrolase [Kaistia dalseonensis]|uniref:Feruloyl esterase n=1 Tax=Kaistia dalseonensis TaxID=410840 RepID=A0ABU0H9Y1_9HYPH|nr:tannase/feruloyl esterase family alpha/beta hydrolase [Kaistia dalseonensis]MCX5496509.1 tannase/feruloyl esterase family alpha/beta hydrolase [Kaistia dalseonensis]MDQ0439131.1 feruloyl esterase [Kaistia dalseonensis]
MTVMMESLRRTSLLIEPTALVGERIVCGDRVVVRVESAKAVSADALGPSGWDLCGTVAPAVRFRSRVPAEGWSGRMLMVGQGGYAGKTSLDLWTSARAMQPAIAGGGFAIVTHDSGHFSPPEPDADGLWALGNPAAIADFAYAAGHRVVIATRRILERLYGRMPDRAYFIGCSAGGRSGLVHAQRFPEDFDGIACEAPNIDMVATNTAWHAWNVRSNQTEEGHPILTSDVLPAIHEAVMDAARAADPEVVDLILDPRTVRFDAVQLTGPNQYGIRLTSEQAAAVNRLHDGPRDENGRLLHPGGLVHGSELGWAGNAVLQPGEAFSMESSMDARYSTEFPDYMASLDGPTGITYRNMTFSSAEFERLDELAAIYDPTDPDLGGLAQRGSKVILWQGWADPSVSPHSTLNYFHAVHNHASDDPDDYLALFMVPGAFHCGYGPRALSSDYLTPLIAWVEQGIRPERLEVADLAIAGSRDLKFTVRRFRPDPQASAPWADWAGAHHYRPGSSATTIMLEARLGRDRSDGDESGTTD